MNKYLRKTILALTVIVLLVLPLRFGDIVSAQSVTSARLSLIPAQEDALLPGSILTVSVLFESGGHDVDAVDVVIAYDANKIDVQNIHGSDLFASYPLTSAENGTIRISGLAAINEPVNGNGTFATFDIHVKDGATGSTSLAVIDSGDTGSHVAEHGTAADVLGETVGATYNIGAASPSATPTPTPIVDALPSTGVVWPTYMIVFLVLITTTFGFVVLR